MVSEWLENYWKEEPNWVKRYIRGSWALNMIMCGLEKGIDKDMWSSKHIKQFIKYMKKVQGKLDKDTILYRGTTSISPTMSPACIEMTNCHFMSTSKSRAIATEFSGRKGGYLHTFMCKKGVPVYDLNDIYGDNIVKREKEVLIYPGCKLTLISKKGNNLVWQVETPD